MILWVENSLKGVTITYKDIHSVYETLSSVQVQKVILNLCLSQELLKPALPNVSVLLT